MGVLNVTPDSFSDGGRYSHTRTAVEHALQMVAEGAELIDIGAESTRPGSSHVPHQEQLRRLMPALKAIRRQTKARISIDTASAAVAEACLNEGADIINDITALRGDARMIGVLRKFSCGVILMHMRGTPKTMQRRPAYKDVVASVRNFLTERIEFCEQHGVARARLVVDPGIGFGKTLEHNLTILRRLKELQQLKRPVLVGLSRKAFLGKISGENIPERRVIESVTASVFAALNGAAILRVHDVAPHIAALKIIAKLQRCAGP